MIELKTAIENYYNQEDPDNLFELNNYLIKTLLEKGFKVQDIDRLMIHILRTKDRAKFKYYLLNKHDNPVCGVCGANDTTLELHHLKSISSNPELAFDESNVCFLCVTCHKIIHHGNTEGGVYLKKRP